MWGLPSETRRKIKSAAHDEINQVLIKSRPGSYANFQRVFFDEQNQHKSVCSVERVCESGRNFQDNKIIERALKSLQHSYRNPIESGKFFCRLGKFSNSSHANVCRCQISTKKPMCNRSQCEIFRENIKRNLNKSKACSFHKRHD